MDRADRTGLGVALVGHVLLFGALSISLLRPTPKLPPLNPPIEVSLVDAKSLQTAAPDAVKEASAPPAASPALAAPMAPPEPVAAPPPPKAAPAPPLPKPVAKTPAKATERPNPKPAPKAAEKVAQKVAAKPKPKPAPAQKASAAPAKKTAAAAAPPRTSRLGGMGAELSQAASKENQRPGTGRGTAEKGSGTPAAKTAAQLEASFIQAMFTKLRKYWRAPTGVDAELLKTNLVVTLNKDGSVGSITVQSQTGENENNSNLKALHAERARNAVLRAAPFELPPEHYAIWQSLGPITFDKRLN